MKPALSTLTTLAVNLHGQRIGTITRPAGDKNVFAFDEQYVENSARPTLSLSCKGRTGQLRTELQQVSRRLPPFFANLLPEGHLRSYLAQQAGVNPEREFFLLAVLGADLPGAVTVSPLHPEHPPDPEEANPLIDPNPRRRSALRFSLAGVQLKFSALIESHGGLTIPAQGIGGSWIVKLPSVNFPAVAENEFVMLELARAAGMQVPPSRLVPVANIQGLPPDAARLTGNALAVERFDRGPGGERIHMEDFAQVFGLFPENKYKSVSYANIARVLSAETGDRGVYEFIRRLTFSVLIGNADMHLKNWSILYPDTRTPVLAPAYDFVSTLPYIHGDQLALTFGASRDISGISFLQLRRFSEKAGLPAHPVFRTVRDSVLATLEAWRKLPAKDLLPAPLRIAIANQIESAAANTQKQINA